MPSLPYSFHVEPAKPHDTDWIFDTWLKSYRESPSAKALTEDDYYDLHRTRFARLLGRSTVLVARYHDPEWPESALGWICAEVHGPTACVHFGYVKNLYRKHGVASALLSAVPIAPETTRLAYSHLRLPYTRILERLGFVYDASLTRR